MEMVENEFTTTVSGLKFERIKLCRWSYLSPH